MNAALITENGGRFYVKGGSFTNKAGYGFARLNGGKFTSQIYSTDSYGLPHGKNVKY